MDKIKDEWGVTANGDRVSFRGDEMFWNKIAVMVARLWQCAKNTELYVYFKRMGFVVCELYLHKAVIEN